MTEEGRATEGASGQGDWLVEGLGRVKTDEMLIWYDGPQLFSARLDDGTGFLCLAVNDTNEQMSWYFAGMSNEDIQATISGTKTLRDAFTKSTSPHLVSYLEKDRWGAQVLQAFDTEALPNEGVHL